MTSPHLEKEVLTLLSRLVEIRTVNSPRDGSVVGPAEAKEIQAALHDHGFTQTSIIDEGGSPIIIGVRGRGRPVGLYMAHVDTVPPGSGWSGDPFKLRVSGERAIGRGVADDKGNVAAISLGLRGYEPPNGTIIVAFTSDEETGGFSGALWLLGWLEERGLLPDYLVNGDGAFSRVIIRRRNVMLTRLRVPASSSKARGCVVEREFTASINKPTRHAAYFTPGVDTHPLLQASDWIRNSDLLAISLWVENVKNNVIPPRARLRALVPCGAEDCREEECREHDYDPNLTRLLAAILPLSRSPFNVEGYSDFGVTSTPNTYYPTSGVHEVEIDTRVMSNDAGHIRERMDTALRENGLEGYELDVASGGGYLNTPRSHWLAQLAARVNRELGLSDQLVEAAGASDSRHYSVRGIPAIDYGPLGWNVHGPDEAVSIPHLLKAVEFYRRLALAIHEDPQRVTRG